MSGTERERGPSTILLVDDDQGLLRLMAKALEREGFHTAGAHSFDEAVDWLKDREPALMLLDLKLGDISGGEVIDHLAQRGRAVPFMIITGQGDERVAVAMMKRGALDYVVKDGDFLEFLPEVVRRVLGQLERDRKLAVAEEALRRSEEALIKEHAFSSAVMATSAALVVVLDRGGRIVRFNPACERVTGFTLEEVKGKLLWELFIVPAEVESVKAVFERLTVGQFPNRHENQWQTRDGGRRLLAWSNSALVDASGAVEYVIGIGIDITDRRRLEEELLHISDTEQRRIGQDLHDGLCQHLAAIELMSQILEQKLAKRSKTAAARVAEISKQVRDAISQTRLLARGLSPVVVESEGLRSALQELATYTEKMFHVRVEFRCASPALVHKHSTASHLYRIAQEAVSNAIRHGRAKHLMIALTTAGGGIELSIQDDGYGLPEDAGKAKGMGLRIMQYRAAMIGGTLSVARRTSGGTEVTCVIQSGQNQLA